MKYTAYSFSLIFSLLLSSFVSAKEISLTVQNGCVDDTEVSVYEFDGFNFSPILTEKTKQGEVVFTMPETRPRVYYIGTNSQNMLPILLGSEDGLTFTCQCKTFRTGKLSGSKLNDGYTALKQKLQTFKGSNRSVQRMLLQAQGDVDKENRALATMSEIDKQKLSLLDSLKRTEPWLATVAELNTYLSYQWYGEGFQDEVNYFANMYFNYANWESVDYNYNPWVFESMKSYTTTLSGINIPSEQHALVLNNVLNKIPKENRTYKLAFGGVLAALESKKHDNYAVFAKKFIEDFKDTEPELSYSLGKKIERMSSMMVGGTAPDFTQNTPDDQPMKLSDLRGKVVLLDFWASWCGPCRKENPNVVRVYNKYKDKGFDVLGVSLDKNKERWLSAIEKDNLTWNHVSDLKGWQNSVAKDYGISSIPATILLDQNGKIIARNLRGPALEQQLKKIFGE